MPTHMSGSGRVFHMKLHGLISVVEGLCGPEPPGYQRVSLHPEGGAVRPRWHLSDSRGPDGEYACLKVGSAISSVLEAWVVAPAAGASLVPL